MITSEPSENGGVPPGSATGPRRRNSAKAQDSDELGDDGTTDAAEVVPKDERKPIVVHSVPIRIPTLPPCPDSPRPKKRVSPLELAPLPSSDDVMPPNWIPPNDNDVPTATAGKLGRRGASHNSSASLASLASARSDCVVTKNSIGFRHVDGEDSDYSSGSSGGEGNNNDAQLRTSQQEGMEVMDLRPNRGSMFRFSSTDSVDSGLAREMFSAAIDASEKSGDKRIGELLSNDRGGRAPYNRTDSETEQAYRALMRMMRSNIEDSDTLTAAGNNNDGTRANRRGSAVSVANSAATDFWSALGPRRMSSSSASDSEGDVEREGRGDDGSSYSELSEGSPLSEKKRMKLLKRKLYVQRCAKAMLVFLALAALSLTVGYFAIEEGGETLFNFLPGSVSLISKEKQQDPQDDIKTEKLSRKERKLRDRKAKRAQTNRRLGLQLQDGGYNNEVAEGYVVDEARMDQVLEHPLNEEGRRLWVPEEDPGYQSVHGEQFVQHYDSNKWGQQVVLAPENPSYQDAHKDQFDQEKHLRREEVWERYEGTDTTTQFFANQNRRK